MRCIGISFSLQVNEGEVVAVGPGRVTEAGAIVAVNVAIGDKVSFSLKFCCYTLTLN
jgi:co-chaperonin GroES (HSP10)